MSNSLCAALNIRAHQPKRGKPTAPQKPTHKPIWLEYGSSVRCKQPSRSCKMVDALVYFVKPINSEFVVCYKDNGKQR